MKFTIATIHSAYGLSYVPDGKEVEQELNGAKACVSLSDINWLKPIDDHKYIADMMLDDEIMGLERVENALQSYFTEQFTEDSSRLLWMPSFHQKHLFCQHYLDGKTVFDVGNTIFSRVLSEIATEIEVLVFHLGDDSLDKLGCPKLSREKNVFGDISIQVTAHKVAENSSLYEDIFKNYNLTLLRQSNSINGLDISDPVLLEQFSNSGKLEIL